MKIAALRALRETRLGGLVTAPVIYGMVVPFLFLDICVTIYQHICLRVYGVPRVRRSEHVVIDRGHLPHMSFRERLNCAYCDYAQGVLDYAGEVVSRTEHFWCPIKHGRTVTRHEPPYYKDYIPYEDTAHFDKKLRQQRARCRACHQDCEKK